MMLFRRAELTDLDPIFLLAEHCGVGMTSLPKNRDVLKKRLELSAKSFKKDIKHPCHEYYLFVLEDLAAKQVIGTSAIEAITGHDYPFYSYKRSSRTRICHSLNIRSDYDVLSLVNDNQNKSELCTLYLEPEYRHSSNGQLLSRARFLFLAQFSHRFSETIIAEMRGISDEQGHSPFWENIGRHFFKMSFREADYLTMATNKQFIADLMPRNELYVQLLAPKAQAVIGKPHESTIPAMNILLKEGFQYTNYVDIFDAGPTIEAPLKRIKTVRASRLMTIKKISDNTSSQKYLLSNTQLAFRATMAEVLLNEEQQTCIISKDTAAVLNVKEGDRLRIASMKINEQFASNNEGQHENKNRETLHR